MGHEAEQSVMVNNLSQLIDLHTRTTDRTEDRALTLEFILTSIPSLYSNISIFPLLDLSQYCVITSSINVTCQNSPPSNRHRHFAVAVQPTAMVSATS